MEKINNLSRGKACLGEKVKDSEGNIGTITNYELTNQKKARLEVTYEDGTSHWREKYAVERGQFRKPYFDDIEDLLNTGEWRYIPGYEGRYIINKNYRIIIKIIFIHLSNYFRIHIFHLFCNFISYSK